VINAFIKPIVQIISIPISCLTFGLFALVINAVLFKLGAAITPGLEVGWWGAFIGAILVSLASGIIFSVVDE
jgi:putative membrane protein